MRQTLFHIPEMLFGLPVLGCGLALGMLVIAILIPHIYQYAKHRKISDVGNSLFVTAIGAALLIFVVPNLSEPGLGIPVRGYGTLMVVAIFVALSLVLYLANKQGIPAAQIYSLGIWTIIIGIVCARLFYVIQYRDEMLQFDPAGQMLLRESMLHILNFTQGGLVVFGSILGGILAALVFMRINKMPVLRTFDIMAPAAALGIAIGRIGCLMNGCCFGGITDAPWAIHFPPGSPAHVQQITHGDTYTHGMKFEERTFAGRKVLAIAEVKPGSNAETLGLQPNMLVYNISVQRDEMQLDVLSAREIVTHRLSLSASDVLPVHPTQIYSSILAFLLCGTLMLLRRSQLYQRRAGLTLASFMILYSLGRFMIEFVRTDEGSFFGTGLTISQNVSIGFFLAGIVLLVYLLRR